MYDDREETEQPGGILSSRGPAGQSPSRAIHSIGTDLPHHCGADARTAGWSGPRWADPAARRSTRLGTERRASELPGTTAAAACSIPEYGERNQPIPGPHTAGAFSGASW